MTTQQPIAPAGATIELEGTFGEAAVVTFPGGVYATATILGTHRATVQVPIGATTGDLSIVGGTAIGPVPFRRTSFAPAVGAFRSTYEQTTFGQMTPSLTTSRMSHASVVTRDHVYVIGGAASPATVEQAVVGADGTLGAFTQSSVILQTPRNVGHSAIVIGNELYVIGGGTTNAVEHATVGDNGVLGPFQTSSGLAAARQGHCSVAVGDRLYVIGGDGVTPLGSTEYATINPDGSLTPFAFGPSNLVTPRHGHVCVVANNRVFVVGGAAGASDQPLTSVEAAPIDGDGNLGAFTVAGSLATPIAYGHTGTVLGTTLYIFGGATSSGTTTQIETATINDDGSLGTFAVSSKTLSSPLYGHSSVVAGNFVYLLGGSGAPTGIERASIAPGGLSPFTPAGTLANPRAGQATATIGRHVYLIGGHTTDGLPLAEVDMATIAADGTLGPFEAAPALVSARDAAAAAVIGPWLYVVAGMTPSGETASIERAPINADGTLGPFATMGTLLTVRHGHAVSVVAGYLYVVGGAQNGMSENSVIGATGALGTFATTSGVAGRAFESMLVANNSMFLIGGHYPSQPDLGAMAVSVVSGTNQSAFSAAGALASACSGQQVAVVGDTVYVIAGDEPTIQTAALGATGSLGTVSAVTQLDSPRGGYTLSATGNYLYVIGGDNGTPLASIERAELQ